MALGTPMTGAGGAISPVITAAAFSVRGDHKSWGGEDEGAESALPRLGAAAAVGDADDDSSAVCAVEAAAAGTETQPERIAAAVVLLPLYCRCRPEATAPCLTLAIEVIAEAPGISVVEASATAASSVASGGMMAASTATSCGSALSPLSSLCISISASPSDASATSFCAASVCAASFSTASCALAAGSCSVRLKPVSAAGAGRGRACRCNIRNTRHQGVTHQEAHTIGPRTARPSHLLLVLLGL